MDINSKEFKELLAQEKLVLVDFYAAWCGPCKVLTPIINQVAEAVSDIAVVRKVNVDKERSLAHKHRILSIPTMVFFKDGKEVQRIAGVRAKDDLLKIIAELV